MNRKGDPELESRQRQGDRVSRFYLSMRPEEWSRVKELFAAALPLATDAREAYLDTGIQRTSVFAEYGWTYLNNFNKSGALILSDHAWRFGLSVEF